MIPVPVDLLLPPVKVPFGEIEAWLPCQAEAYLTGLFGDWRRLPPPEMRRPGHVTAADFGIQVDTAAALRRRAEA